MFKATENRDLFSFSATLEYVVVCNNLCKTLPDTDFHLIQLLNIQSHKPCSRKMTILGVKRDEISNIIQTDRLYLVTCVCELEREQR